MLDRMRLSAVHFAVASVSVLLAFALCEIVQEARQFVLPHGGGTLHAIFLPFGAMVLLTWVYGWMAVPLMLPAAVLAVGSILGPSALTWSLLAVLVAKVVAVPLSFGLFRGAGLDARGTGSAANWRVVIAVGLVAALIGNVPRVLIGPCCGGFTVQERLSSFVTVTAADIAGLLLVMVSAMVVFRLMRQV